jgi:hypothetical protein
MIPKLTSLYFAAVGRHPSVILLAKQGMHGRGCVLGFKSDVECVGGHKDEYDASTRKVAEGSKVNTRPSDLDK